MSSITNLMNSLKATYAFYGTVLFELIVDNKNISTNTGVLNMLKLDQDEVLRYLGYRPGVTVTDGEIMAKVKRYMNFGSSLIDLRSTYKLFNAGDICREKVVLSGLSDEKNLEISVGFAEDNELKPTLILKSYDLALHLKNSEIVCIMGVTISSYLENQVSELFKNGEYAAATILDAVGSEAVEKACDLIEEEINKLAHSMGYTTTGRFSPGYGDVPLELNLDFAGVLDLDSIGMSVTSTSMLIPRKSVTAVIGFTRGESDRKEKNKCANCTTLDCKFRNTV